jgi:leucyl/phenylalanyl-tRNA---protein transferase
VRFPDPLQADAEGLVAIGADLRPERLLHAYDCGIFPWYSKGLPILWWSPDPRGVLVPSRVHVSRSMQREIRAARYRLTYDRAFLQVLSECANERADGTWLSRDMQSAYHLLHLGGDAHSLEVWSGSELVGGIYGVQRGALFAAESMFHRRTNCSKLALISLCRTMAAAGVQLIDVQFVTPHLQSLGATTMTRANYLALVEKLRCVPCNLASLTPVL